MKILQLVFLLVIIMFSTHCGNEEAPGEPIPYVHFFVFVDENGNDFFATNPLYIADSVKYHYKDNAYLRDFISYKFKYEGYHNEDYENYNVFESVVWSYEQYIIFGNGDIDTLHATWRPSGLNPIISFFLPEFKEFSYYYNGELIDHWNFETGEGISQRDLKESFKVRTPYITEIRKDPDPDEFNK